jgi:hypothetical protein
VLDGPVLHRGGNDVGGGRIERRAGGNGLAQRAIDVARKPALLHLVVECQRAENFGGFRAVVRWAARALPVGDVTDGIEQSSGGHGEALFVAREIVNREKIWRKLTRRLFSGTSYRL